MLRLMILNSPSINQDQQFGKDKKVFAEEELLTRVFVQCLCLQLIDLTETLSKASV